MAGDEEERSEMDDLQRGEEGIAWKTRAAGCSGEV